MKYLKLYNAIFVVFQANGKFLNEIAIFSPSLFYTIPIRCGFSAILVFFSLKLKCT